MDAIHLTHACEKLAARLNDAALTRHQLIDIATVLTFVQWDLDRRFAARCGPDGNDLDISLLWVRNHASEATDGELRFHVAAAVDAVNRVLACETSARAGESPLLSQEPTQA